MATLQINRIVKHLRHTAMARDLSDGQLLDCYIARREEAAFELLVRRHGPMVLGVCRRTLGNHHDAEDAFQATFLVLVRKAASIKPRELVGNWLHGVAHQTALKARTLAQRRAAREKQMAVMPEPLATPDERMCDLRPFLDQELSRLSDTYRVPIVLCDLQGKTRKEAAAQLGVPEGTINSRLARARAMLAKRLTQKGVTLTAAALAALLAQQTASANVPASLVCATVKAGSAFAVGDMVSGKAAALADSVLHGMLLTRLKLAAAVVLMLGFFIGGVLLLQQNADAQVHAENCVAHEAKPIERKGEAVVQPASDWLPLKKSNLLAVDVERCLYEVKGEKRFLMAVRLTNLTKAEIGVDWQEPRPRLYANQWGVHDTKQRGIIDERRVVREPPDQDKVRADFKAGRLTRIPAGKSIIVWAEFNNSGRADVDASQGKFFIVSMDGQFCATDGAAVETISCEWKKGVGSNETDVVMPFPVKWKKKQDPPKPG